MYFLRNFTIRRVVQVILLAALLVVALAGTYGSAVLHDMHQRDGGRDALTAQLLFLTHAGNVMASGSPAEKAALQADLPQEAAWAPVRRALSETPALFSAASNERLVWLQHQLASDEAAMTRDRHRLEAAFIIAALVTLGLLAFCDRFLVTHLVKPLGVMREYFKRIAAGDLSREPQEFGRNCVGQLVPLVRLMQQSLLTTVLSVRDNTVVLRQEAADIAAGNTDLSDRTTRQAAALEQTAASMEELTATVKNNALSAREARELAGATTHTTQQGETLVTSVSTLMSDIAEEAEKIRQFTATINSIAFQTNILALNAAVEAARAGEQGRGFAVVASEVRTLAQRSAAAAKEIEGLISGAVTRVQEGAVVAARAGDTMGSVTKSVAAVNDLIGQIALASDEQSKGISQVTLAIADLDRVTQQNASLVQQVTASAGSLSGRTETLASAISHFKTADLPAEDGHLLASPNGVNPFAAAQRLSGIR
ncbi:MULTISPECIES: methyl-accepting chemotaxis protein [Pantoea]|jgi:methyl-accepting chemotaxis protein|nr:MULTISPECIES: methyl-accepting chemotaxis protein [Pantoea]MBZ6400029.1 methyl-accepting chemotaxis protein [Pantoea piersonii]MBZ6407892.1 methyl-accepting chemotaxis protein [Pantoea piersonii]MBZ6427547.1 methyl-accepting chemotaxis protein [Pantoea piersonii]NYB03127.1 transcription factor [Pantoea piersonii]NYB08079.1 transcription factor [Pantoea piersonii]